MGFSSSCLLLVITGANSDDGSVKHLDVNKLSSLKFGNFVLPCVRSFTSSKLELSPLFEKPVHKQYSRTEVSNHCDSSSCWIVLDDKIYDVTEFLSKHPGGSDIILENAGRDATVPFKDKGHSKEAIRLIDQYYIGDLTVSDRLRRH